MVGADVASAGAAMPMVGADVASAGAAMPMVAVDTPSVEGGMVEVEGVPTVVGAGRFHPELEALAADGISCRPLRFWRHPRTLPFAVYSVNASRVHGQPLSYRVQSVAGSGVRSAGTAVRPCGSFRSAGSCRAAYKIICIADPQMAIHTPAQQGGGLPSPAC